MALDTDTWKWILVVLGILNACNGMRIPEDMNIFDGYDIDFLNTKLANNDSGLYEKRSLMEPLYYRAIRDKRATRYRGMKSPDLLSQTMSGEGIKMYAKKRVRRDVKVREVPVTTNPPDGIETGEKMPNAEKQIMNDAAQMIADQWAISYNAPAFQSKKIAKESDSDAEASTIIKEGIKSRTPRVNFITQQTKSPELFTDTQREDLYRKPATRAYYVRPPRDYDSYMAPSQSPMFPRIYDKYDAFHRDMMDRLHPPSPQHYDQYYQRRYDVEYDSYYPRYKFPYFYYYPDKHYDTPLHYRDRNYVYTNDIAVYSSSIHPTDHASLPPASVAATVRPVMLNRRIIYYATLPEIVRTPINADLSYRYTKHNRNRYESLYSTRAPPALSGYNDLRLVNEQNRKKDNYVSSNPIKIVSEVTPTQAKQKEQISTLGARSLDVKNFHRSQRKWGIRSDGIGLVSDRSVFRNARLAVDQRRWEITERR